MHSPDFDVQILQLNWLKHADDPADLCAHGSVYVTIGGKAIVNEEDGDGWTLSAAALNLMRTLDRNYSPGDFAGQLIPCCGFFLVPDDAGEHVEIMGCENGIEWTVQQEGDFIRHIAASGEQALIGREDYKELVLSFADKVERFYHDSAPKTLPADDFDRKGYLTFWKEWRRLRGKWG